MDDTPQTEVVTRINEFSVSQRSDQWRHLKKDALVAQLWLRVKNSYGVSQGVSFLCGPTAIIFALIKSNPSRYVQICQQLFETGGFEARGRKYTASQALREAEFTSSGM